MLISLKIISKHSWCGFKLPKNMAFIRICCVVQLIVVHNHFFWIVKNSNLFKAINHWDKVWASPCFFFEPKHIHQMVPDKYEQCTGFVVLVMPPLFFLQFIMIDDEMALEIQLLCLCFSHRKGHMAMEQLGARKQSCPTDNGGGAGIEETGCCSSPLSF